MTLTWYRHFERNGGLNQILKRQTSRFHYGSKVDIYSESQSCGGCLETLSLEQSIGAQANTSPTRLVVIHFNYMYANNQTLQLTHEWLENPGRYYEPQPYDAAWEH
jgi:hypothetical protein